MSVRRGVLQPDGCISILSLGGLDPAEGPETHVVFGPHCCPEVSTMDFGYELARNWWTHPETNVRILDEDMPPELRPHGWPTLPRT